MGMHSDENGPWTCLPGPHRYHGGGREESARICGHASEDERNRQVFQNYLHSTLNLSKAEWLAEKLSPAIHALLGRYKHRETGKQHNVIVDEVFVKWREEKETIMNPTTAPKPKHPRKTPDVAKAEDLTKVNTSRRRIKPSARMCPSLDQALTSAPSTSASTILSLRMMMERPPTRSYEAPGTAALVDDGDYNVPIPSSMGRVVEPAKEVPKPSRKSDRDEDAIHRPMFVDQSAPQGAAPVLGRLPNEYFYNGQKHRLMPLNPEDIVGDKNVKFHHENLKFLSLLLRGHELEDHPLLYDKGCWTDVDKLLDHFNYCRDRRSGVRQLLRAAKADKKGRIRLQGIDIPTRETIGQPLFPVRIRVSQGLKKLVQDVDTDLFLATRFYSLLDDSQAERMSSVKGVAVLPFNQGSFIIARMREGWLAFFRVEWCPDRQNRTGLTTITRRSASTTRGTRVG